MHAGLLAVKSVRQRYQPTPETRRLLEAFRCMVNDCITIGLATKVTSLKRLAILSWPRRQGYNCPGYYKASAVSRAAGVLSARRKSLRRGVPSKSPYSLRPMLTAYQGFKIQNGSLRVPLGQRKYYSIPLTRHTLEIISDPSLTVRSFALTRTNLSLCVSREVALIDCTGTIGVDRNLRNLTVGNDKGIVRYDLSKTVRIAETTTRIIRSYKHDDARNRKRIVSKYGRRRHDRVQHLLHNATKQIVAHAFENKQAIVLENIHGIRRLYRRGNGQARRYRGRMNGWSYGEAQRQIEYKASWLGLPVIRLSRGETMGTSTVCPVCGERLQEDGRLRRKLWCGKCRMILDRDMVAAVNLSRRGRLRFDRSQTKWSKGGADEAMNGNPDAYGNPGVDAPKSRTSVRQPKT